MGCSNKSLLPLGHKPAIRWCLDTLLAAGLDDVVVVLSSTGTIIAEQIADLPVTLAWNIAPNSDMASSVLVGLAKANRAAEALLIFPADYPLVSPATIIMLLQNQAAHPDKIIIPAYQGRKGHPVIFPRPILAELGFHSTLRNVVRWDPQRLELVAVEDEAILLDMDTPEDYRRLQTVISRSDQPNA